MPRLSIAAIVAAFLCPAAASAHSFYDTFCCHERDCTPIPDGSIEENETGFAVDYISPITGRHITGTIRRGDAGVRWSPDGREHACERVDKAAPRCIYIPIPTN